MPLKIKLILLMVATLGAAIFVSYTIFERGEDELLQQVVQHVKSVENVGNVLEIQQFLTRTPNQTIERTLSVRMGQHGRVSQVSLLDLEYRVIASSKQEDIGLTLAQLEDRRIHHPQTPLWESLLKQHLKTYDVTIPLYENGVRRGYVNAIIVMNDLDYLIKKTQYANLLWIIVIFACGTVVAVVMVSRFTRPIDQLVIASKAVANGNFETTIAAKSSGELHTLISGFNDMTANLRQHHALEQRVHRSERMAALGELGARLAHEIRNPLNSITLIIDHLRDRFRPADDKERQRFDNYVTNIKTELQRLNKLVTDFLQVSRPLHPNIQPVPVAPLLREITQLIEKQAAQQRVRISMSVAPENLHILGDDGLLKTACLNIALNAIQAMEQGGTLDIQATPAAEARLCEIVFADSGIGIPREHIENIFQPYFTTKKEGTGLGLSIVNRVIEDHNGQIRVETAPGVGTTMRLLLPMPA